MSQDEIWTQRLLLRAVEESDLDDFRKFFSDLEAMKYEATAAHKNIGQTKNFIECVIDGPYNGILDFSVCLRDLTRDPADSENTSMVVIGYTGIRDEEIGFIFNSDYWGNGYALEALDALLKHFWATDGDVNAVVKADVDPRNKASLHILTKFGFVVVGTAEKTFKTHIGWCDSVYLEARRPAK